MKIEFIKKVGWKEAYKFLDEAKKRKIEIGLITEWGSIIPNDVKFIVEFGVNGEADYIATKGFLQRSDDGIFVRLKKDGKEIGLPRFEDIFKVISIEPCK